MYNKNKSETNTTVLFCKKENLFHIIKKRCCISLGENNQQ